MELYAPNAITARSLAHFDRTVALLTDVRPGFDRDSAIEMGRRLQEHGYFVYELSVAELLAKNLALLGNMLIVPHAQSVPAEAAQALKHYWKQGGQILVLGGPVFCDRIEKENGEYVQKELPPTVLDAVHFGSTGEITIEGIVPSQKVYIEQGAERMMTESAQMISNAVLEPEGPETVVCPAARPYGIGYGMEHKNRFIPIVQVIAKGGRADGRRGAAAFVMLSDTRGHLRFTNGSRPGSVSATVMGSAIGCIGIQRQDLLNIPGAGELLADMADALCRGLYLYEGGADAFVFHAGDRCRIGAKILNTTQDFREAEVRFTLHRGDECVWEKLSSKLVMPRTYTDCDGMEIGFKERGDYRLVTELVYGGKVIDRIVQEITVKTREAGRPEEYVGVSGGNFTLGGKPWYLFGISYWPLFYPSLDREDYWMGWLDRSNYDPVETERDLSQLEEMGLNCVFTRLDGNVFDRTIPQLRDFLERCRRHNLKVALSWCNATNPLNYCSKAFHQLVDAAELRGDPVLFGHDISWETGHQYFMENYLPQWTDRWVKWIGERYGSIENAERDWGVALDRAEDGSATSPPPEQFEHDGPWRIKICAFRRFLDNMLSRLWNDAVTDMRTADPDHLIGYRMGCFPKNGGAALTSTNKHMDYSGLEGYTFDHSEGGYYASACLTRVSELLTGGKPVVWVEYGSNLIGMTGNSAWSVLKWKRETLMPYPEKLAEQTDYAGQFYRMFRETSACGSVPWWYAGGFRRVECSDCGFIAPNGELRSAAEAYVEMGKDWFLKPRERRKPDTVISFDPDSHAAGWGNFCLGSGPVDRFEITWAEATGEKLKEAAIYGAGVEACRKAGESGTTVAFTTPGFGTNSADTPMLAVGNVPCNGCNPAKYLDAEFNEILLFTDTGDIIPVRDGDAVCVPPRTRIYAQAEVGNLREATWLADDVGGIGAVGMAVDIGGGERIVLKIRDDTPYLEDAAVYRQLLTEGIDGDTELRFRMTAHGRTDFGEIWRIRLQLCDKNI